MRLISDGVVDREGVSGLAARLGYSARQVQRQLNAELGAGPVALARAQRAHTARVLLQTTGLQAADIAFAAGFASVRQFNDTIKEIYALTPSELRAARPGKTARYGPVAPHAMPGVLPLRLAFRGPYAARQLFDHLQRRALTGIEEVSGEPGARTYRRTLRLPNGTGIAEVDEAAGDGWLDCRLRLTELRDLTTAGQRVRRLFDLDADPYAVAERLAEDPVLARLVAERPGLRSPGAAAPDELAVRAVLGQQVSVAAAALSAPPWSPRTANRCWSRPVRSPISSLASTTWRGPRSRKSACPSRGGRPCAPSVPRSPTAASRWTPEPTGTRPSARCSGCAASARGPPATSGCAPSGTPMCC